MGSIGRRVARNSNEQTWGTRGASNAQVAKALLAHLGNAAKAADETGLSVASLYRRIAGSRELRVLRYSLELALAEGKSATVAREEALRKVKEL